MKAGRSGARRCRRWVPTLGRCRTTASWNVGDVACAHAANIGRGQPLARAHRPIAPPRPAADRRPSRVTRRPPAAVHHACFAFRPTAACHTAVASSSVPARPSPNRIKTTFFQKAICFGPWFLGCASTSPRAPSPGLVVEPSVAPPRVCEARSPPARNDSRSARPAGAQRPVWSAKRPWYTSLMKMIDLAAAAALPDSELLQRLVALASQGARGLRRAGGSPRCARGTTGALRRAGLRLALQLLHGRPAIVRGCRVHPHRGRASLPALPGGAGASRLRRADVDVRPPAPPPSHAGEPPGGAGAGQRSHAAGDRGPGRGAGAAAGCSEHGAEASRDRRVRLVRRVLLSRLESDAVSIDSTAALRVYRARHHPSKGWRRPP